MKKTLKVLAIILLFGIVTIAAAFYINPSYCFKLLFPVKIEVTTANTRISEEIISIDLQLILKESKRIKYFSDSIDYGIFLDEGLLVQGSYNIEQLELNGEIDTIFLPIELSRTVLKSKLSKFNEGDSTNLKIKIINHVKYPILGVMDIPIERDFRIAAPQPPVVTMLDVKKIKLSMKDAVYQIDLDIYNPNYISLAILEADLYIDIKTLFKGKARSKNVINVKPKEHTKLSVNIDIDEFNLVNDGLKIIFKPQKEWEYYLVIKGLLEQKDAKPVEITLKNSGKTKLLGLK